MILKICVNIELVFIKYLKIANYFVVVCFMFNYKYMWKIEVKMENAMDKAKICANFNFLCANYWTHQNNVKNFTV